MSDLFTEYCPECDQPVIVINDDPENFRSPCPHCGVWFNQAGQVFEGPEDDPIDDDDFDEFWFDELWSEK